MSYDGHCGATVSSIRPRAGRPLLQRHFRTALSKCGHRGGRISKNMCFCETNRIGFMTKTGDNTLRWSRIRSKGVKISIRFVFGESGIAMEARKGAECGILSARVEN